jgi:cytochrome c-type biogenesis protein CcmH/NrfG
VSQEQKHLSAEQIDCLIEYQPGVPERLAPSELLQEARRHLVTCEACQRLVLMHKEFDRNLRRLSEELPKEAANDCPPEESLNELAASLSDPGEAETMLRHAVQCDHCGPLLKNAAGIFSDEAIPGEDMKLAQLRSGQPVWQRNLIARLSHAARDPDTGQVVSPRREVHSWPRWLFAAVASASALLLLAGSALWLRSARPQLSAANQLVLQSYAEHRTVRTRFPGAHHAPVVDRRGGGQRSFSETPQALREAEAMIARGLQANPGDAGWLQLKGRAELLEGDFGPAAATLESALMKKPRDASLQVDLASAYFQSGDYGRAAALLTEALQSQSDNPVALFNLAIVMDSQHKYREAIPYWTRYLELDPAGEWSSEAQQHLDNAKALAHGN